jgi:hypothetical protein
VAISMAGRGRALDNVFVARLWRTVQFAASVAQLFYPVLLGP